MQVSTQTVNQLLTIALNKADAERKHHGLKKLSEAIRQQLGDSLITHKYLYDYVLKRIEKAILSGNSEIGISKDYLNQMAQFTGFKDFFEFEKSLRLNKKSFNILFFKDKIEKDLLGFKPMVGRLHLDKTCILESDFFNTTFIPRKIIHHKIMSDQWLSIHTEDKTKLILALYSRSGYDYVIEQADDLSELLHERYLI